MSESSWTALATGNERGWWNVDLEGDMEKLEVTGQWSGTEGGSVDAKGKMATRKRKRKKKKEEKQNEKKKRNKKKGPSSRDGPKN